MDTTPSCHFFLQPAADTQRLYEALRAVCVEGCRQKDVAERFGYDYAAFRQQEARYAESWFSTITGEVWG